MEKKILIETKAAEMVEKSGIVNLSREALCEAAGVPDGSFVHIMGVSFTDFKNGLGADKEFYTVSKKRLSKIERKDHILHVALEMAKHGGYLSVSRNDLASRAEVSSALVTHYFGTMAQLQRAIMRAAITQEIPEIVAQGLANGDNNARKAPPALKEKAAQLLASL